MSTPTLRIKVGAALDTSTLGVFKPVIEAARQARLAIDKELGRVSVKAAGGGAGGSGGGGGSANAQADAHVKATEKWLKHRQRILENSVRMEERMQDKAVRAVEKAEDKKVAAVEKAEAKKWAIVEREAQKRLDAFVREGKKAEREAARAEKRASRKQERDNTVAGNRQADLAYRVGYHSMRYFDSAVRTGVGVASSMARGAGIDFNLGSMVAAANDREQRATILSNNSWMPNGTNAAARQRISGAEIMADVKAAANHAALDPTEALAGLEKFVGLTGDLKTGRGLLKEIAVLSKATGASMADMQGAAGNIANALGDIPDKEKAALEVLRAFVGQAAVGAIEVGDIAHQGAQITAVAGRFKLDKSTSDMFSRVGVTTDIGQNIATMGVLSQAARQSGAKPSATQAMHSAKAFVADLSSGTSMARFAEVGLSAFTDGTHTMKRDPKAIILDILAKTQGDQGKIGRLMPQAGSRSVVEAFAETFTKAGKGKAGLQAVEARYDELAKSVADQDEIAEKFKAAMATNASSAQLFQNKLQDVSNQVQGSLMPALVKLEEPILRAVSAFASLVSWGAENPGQAIVLAITGSIARAGLENVLRLALENAIRGKVGGVPLPPGGVGGVGAPVGVGGGRGVLGTLGAAAIIGAVAYDAVVAGEAAIDSSDDDDKKDKQKRFKVRTEALNAMAVYRESAAAGAPTPKATADVREKLAALRQQQLKEIKEADKGRASEGSGLGGVTSPAVSSYLGFVHDNDRKEATDAVTVDTQALWAIQQELQNLAPPDVQKVFLMNPGEVLRAPAPPLAPGEGRHVVTTFGEDK